MSELLRAAQDLENSQRLLRAIFDGSLDAMLLADDEARCLDVNDAACRLLGLERDALLGRSVTDSLAPLREDCHELWRALLETGTRVGQGAVVRPDGEVRQVDVSAKANVVPGLHLLVLRDVTQRVRTEARFMAMVEKSEDAVVLLDHAGNFTYAAPSIERVLGFSPEEVIRLPWNELVDPEDRARIAALLDDLLQRPGGSLRAEGRVIWSDGTKHWAEAAVTNLLDDPSVGAIAGSFRNIDDRKRTEAQLRQNQKLEAIGLLAGGIAHDFNNVLSVILSFSELLKDDMPSDDPKRLEVDEIHGAAQRAASLTRQLLAFGRRQVSQPVVLDMNRTLRDMEKMLCRLLGEDIELLIHRHARNGCVMADPGQLEQVILNLAVNARDAMPRGGHLSIDTRTADVDVTQAATLGLRPGPYVRVSVSDTGTGMDEATMSRIFEPFFTTKPLGQGTGLGLSTVFGIVKQSGGQVTVASEVGRGTRFDVYLPRADRTDVAQVQSVPPPATLGGTETILLVEDDDQVRALVGDTLRRRGYTLLQAHNAGEALLMAESHAAPIHLLLTDVVLPRVSGRELAVRLGALRPDMRVLYMSGYTSDAITRHGVIECDVPFVAKPFTTTSLARNVREILDR